MLKEPSRIKTALSGAGLVLLIVIIAILAIITLVVSTVYWFGKQVIMFVRGRPTESWNEFMFGWADDLYLDENE